jgi:phosphoglycolate phosphatase
VTRGKPDPETLLLALGESQVSHEHAWMVGDTIWDVQMARAAGVYAVAVEGGSHGHASLSGAEPDRLLDGLDAIAGCLEEARVGQLS